MDHVIVLMEENRSFDHMLGLMMEGGPQGDTRVDGISTTAPTFCNRINISLPISASNRLCVTADALDVCPYDPNHGFEATTERIFSCKYKDAHYAGTPCVDRTITDPSVAKPDMGGFVQSGIWNKHDGKNEMSAWAPEDVPIITTLAKSFANFDAFHCDHAGPTFPNRQFVNSGTAYGEQNDEVPAGGFPQKTIWRLIEENNMTWAVYYEDSLAWANFNADLRRPEAQANIKEMADFYTAAKAGTLPNYVFIEPRISANANASDLPSYGLANHQHPVASVREGERLMKNVYEAVRQGPCWEQSLLVVTYDEHGGFYDHVSPPFGAPSPDGRATADGFNYQWLGVRVPTIVISAYIPKGTLVHLPSKSQQQMDNSQWSTSSILATTQRVLGLEGGPLTARDAWAATFEDLLSLDTPRTDCPLELPVVPPPPASELERQLSLPLDEHAHHVIRTLCDLVDQREHLQVAGAGGLSLDSSFCTELAICPRTDVACGSGLATNSDFAAWRVQMWARYRSTFEL